MQLSLSGLAESLGARVIHRASDFNGRQVRKVVACDLMSDVLVEEGDDFLILTYLASEQVARTADMVSASGILLVGGKEPQPALVTTAGELNITLLQTSLDCFEACVALGKLVQP